VPGFEVLTTVFMKSPVLWDMSTDVSEEHIASIFRVDE
jgi:hypothetical protein